MKLKKILLFSVPSIFFLIPALLGLALEGYNRHYRGIPTPFLMPSLGLILIALFFLARKRWMYFALAILTLGYLAAILALGFVGFPKSPVVFYYRHWQLNTQTGRLVLKEPLGLYPPASGAYITCSFSLKNWKDFLDNQPLLCTAFDDQLRLSMFISDHDTDEGVLREFQINQFKVERKSLLGDPLDRSAVRIAFIPTHQGLRPKYKIKKIYQAFEREIEPGIYRVIESFSRNPQGKLETFTESSLFNLTAKDVFAVYDHNGVLVKIPPGHGKTFAFPARVDVSRLMDYSLPPLLQPGIL